MEELRVNSFPVHTLQKRYADRVCKKNSSVAYSPGMSPKLKLCQRARSSSPPASLSPPSTPSLECPFIHPDSTSTAPSLSLAPPPLYKSSSSHASSLIYLSQSKPLTFIEDGGQLPPAQSDMSSPCHVASTGQSMASEVAIDRTFVESVSLEQHLHQCGAGREAAMQSFILDRFLPAAKAVAADHDCTLYSTSKGHATMSSTMPSMSPYASICNSTKKTLSPPSIKSRVPPTLNASKDVTRSCPGYQYDSETESFNHEAPTKSCGSFCVGLKTALSRVHKVVHTSAHVASRSKSRAMPSSIDGASSDEEEDVIPKVKVLAQPGMRKQGSAHVPASYSLSSPVIATVEGRASKYMANSRSSPRHHQAGCYMMPTQKPSIPDNEDLSSSGRKPMNVHNLRRIPPCDDGGVSPHWDHFKETPGGISLEGRPLRNASRYAASGGSILDRAASKGSPACCNTIEGASSEITLEGRPLQYSVEGASGKISLNGGPLRQSTAGGGPIRDPSSRAVSKGSPARHHVVDDALKDQDCTENDEHEFHDALSRFDSSTSIPSDDATPLTCRPLKSQKAFGPPSKQTTDEDCSVDTSSYVKVPHAGICSSKSLSSDANHEGHLEALLGEQKGGAESASRHVSCECHTLVGSAHTTATKHKPGQQACVDRGKECFPRTIKRAYSLNPSFVAPPIFKCQGITPNGHEKWASPPVLGWPLGITRFQGGMKKAASSTEEHAKNDDGCVASPNSALTDSNASSPPVPPNVHGVSPNVSTPLVSPDVSSPSVPPNVSSPRVSPNVSSPPVPPSPIGSWLGRAMALNASKPSSPLATLQQKEKSTSVRKKLEFTVLDAKKEVRWEDMVKGSQMHLEQFRLSEEIRHNHPSNRSAMKPLRL